MERQEPVVYSQDINKSPLDQSLIKHYESNGFVVLDNFFDREYIDTLLDEANRLREISEGNATIPAFKERETSEIRSIFQIHLLSPVFNQLLHDEKLMSIARFILGDDVYIHQARVNYKPGFRGKEFYWHSDFETWHMEDGMPGMRAISVSITLTENFEFNGPLMLIPGSHRSYVRCKGATPKNHYQHSLIKQDYGTPDDDSLKMLVHQGNIVSTPGKPGTLVIFDCNTMHGSNGNITPFNRVNLFFVYNAVSNKLVAPFCGLPPRPEFLAAR